MNKQSCNIKITMLGEHGSGKTSFMNCLTSINGSDVSTIASCGTSSYVFINWNKDFSVKFTYQDYYCDSSLKANIKSHSKHKTWDVKLIVTFTKKLAELFPEELDEWQHWISDMMDSRIRMQAKGMNHRLVSLITFYRLTRFAFHIGIDKVFILATRRATR